MRKTKIICTMGPSTDKGDVMEQLVREGMDVARFNFSHGPHDEQRGRIQKLRELRKKYDRPVAALLDTKGPEIRLGCFKDGKVSLEEGQIFTFTNKDIEGTNECVSNDLNASLSYSVKRSLSNKYWNLRASPFTICIAISQAFS